MTYETAKYILWALMCIPVLWLSIYMILSIMDDTIEIRRRNAARKKKLLEEQKRRQLRGSGRGGFNTDFDPGKYRRNGR